MKITTQQALILFDIAKGCLYSVEKQFAGYSKEDIGRLLNDIITQQDNEYIITEETHEIKEVQKEEDNDFWD